MSSDDQSDTYSYCSRRAALAIGASGVATAMSGCQGSSSSDETPMLELVVDNGTPEPQEVAVQIIDPEEDNGEVLVYDLSDDVGDRGAAYVELPADSERRVEAVAEDQRYTIRARVEQDSDRWRHYHYTAGSVDYDAQVVVLITRLEATGRAVVRFLPGP